jgi:cbb3-type cytochrome oxidase cytochrome c subunit
MNQGPVIFLGVFLALAGSWFGLIFQPQLQLGAAKQETNLVNTTELYPQMRPGLAKQGLEVYRSLGCATCHSQQVRETGRIYDVVITDAGTNLNQLVDALLSVKSGAARPEAQALISKMPATVLAGVNRKTADGAVEKLKATGAQAVVQIVPLGPDIAREWGKRRTVAADFLFDQPVMLGSQRVGPDLANVGLRQTNSAPLLLHLYHPKLTELASVMPPYRFLFEKRKIGRQPAPDALALTGDLAPERGYEIVPRDQAKALVAYLRSLRADAPVFEAPLTPPPTAPSAATNAPATTATNAQPITATNALAK